MFTAKMPRQPAAATSRPPSSGPSAALVPLAMEMPASVPAGVGPAPTIRRTSANPAGNAAEVPTACRTRHPTSHPNPGDARAAIPATPAMTSPAQ